MRKTWIAGLSLITLAGLTSCGPLHEGNTKVDVAREIAAVLADKVGGLVAPAEADSVEGAETTGLTRSFIEDFNAPLLRISIISREDTGIVYWAGENGSKVTWNTEDGSSFTFDSGLIVGTRGYGTDLMGSDVSGAKQSLQAGGSHFRMLDFLNTLAQIERYSYQCQTVQTGRETITLYERSYATTVFEETCTGENNDFKNTYWRDANGVIWQSRQWVSAGIGYIGYQRL